MTRLTFVLLIILFFFNSNAQRGIHPEFSIELGAGIFDYQGDLDNAPGFAILEDFSYSYQLIARKKIKYPFDIGFQFFTTTIKAKKDYTNPNTGEKDGMAYDQLESNHNQVALNFYFDISGFNNNVKRRYGNPKINYYIYSGFSFGLGKAEVRSTISEDRFNLLTEYDARNSSYFTMTLPLGVGFKYYFYEIHINWI